MISIATTNVMTIEPMEGDKFPAWLNTELSKRGWSQRELGRRAGIAGGTVSNLITGQRGRGIDSLTAIARAFEMPPEEVFRIAGVFAPVPSDTEYHQELLGIIARYGPEQKAMLIEYARFLLKRS